MSGPRQFFGIDSASVIAYPHGQVTVGIFKLENDAPGSGMTKRIEQGFFANPVQLLADGRLERLLAADNTDAEIQLWRDHEFPANARQGRNQVRCA